MRNWWRGFLWFCLLLAGWPPPSWSRCSPVPYVRFNPPPFRTGYFEVHNTLNGLPCDRIRCLLIAGDRVLAGTDGGGLMVWKEGAWAAYSPDSKPPFPAPTVISLIRGREPDTVLAGTIAGIVKITLRDQPVFEPVPVAGDMSPNVLSMADSAAEMYVGTDRQPGRFDQGMFIPIPFFEEDTPAGVTCIAFQDRHPMFGNSNGLFQLQGGALHKIASPGADLGWVNGLLERNKALFAAASNGLYRFTGALEVLVPGVWTTCLSLPPELPPPPDKAFRSSGVMDEGSEAMRYGPEFKRKLELIGDSERRVNDLALQIGRYAARQEPPPPSLNARYYAAREEFAKMAREFTAQVQGAARLEKGLWVGTQDSGAILFGSDGVRRDLTTENSKLPSNRITALATAESGETWIGTWDAGLVRYCLISVAPSQNPVPIWEGKANLVRTLGEHVYIGTKENGLLVYDPRSQAFTAEYSRKLINGFHKEVTGVALDHQSRLWVGGSAGVWMMDSRGWHRFGIAEGMADETVTCVECDTEGRIYVTAGAGAEISRQLSAYNGEGFTSYSVENVRRFLALPPASAARALEGLGMAGGYLGRFDLKSPQKALREYDDGATGGWVSAMYGNSDFLWLGTREGNLLVFTGEKFQRVDNGELGRLGPIAAIGRRRNGDLVFVASARVLRLDGSHFESVPPVLGISVSRYTGLAIDPKNPDLFWVSFDALDQGGIALFQEPFWSETTFPFPVRGLALADPFVFLLGDDAVYSVLR